MQPTVHVLIFINTMYKLMYILTFRFDPDNHIRMVFNCGIKRNLFLFTVRSSIAAVMPRQGAMFLAPLDKFSLELQKKSFNHIFVILGSGY